MMLFAELISISDWQP